MKEVGLSDQVFCIPLNESRYIIYAPLKRTAFIGNAELVNVVHARLKQPESKGVDIPFLDDLDFFSPEPPPADEFAPTGTVYDSLILFLTNRCNLRCTYCYASAGDFPVQNMSPDIAEAAVRFVSEEVRREGLEEMTIGFHGGGEPTINMPLLRQVVDLSMETAERDSVRLNLSGSFNGYWSESVRSFILAHFTDISLSFDGLAEVQNNQRPVAGGGGSFDRVIETLYALDQSPVRYGIRMTVTEAGIDRLPQSIDYICQRFSPEKIQIEPVFLEGRARNYKSLLKNHDNFVSRYMESYRIAEKFEIPLFYSGAQLDVLTTRFCLASCRALVVTPEGNITTCFEIFGSSHPLAENYLIGEYNGHEFVIDKEKRQAVFDRTVDTIPYCRDCFAKWHCAGDCAVKSGAVTKLQEQHSGRCRINRELLKHLILDRISKSGGLIWQGLHDMTGSNGEGE
ncbi:MAG: radical SAM protein [Candidatus Aminicenantes bacterium]|nr:radical SAM protein [Candidatus Aminicenantes bacterium]